MLGAPAVRVGTTRAVDRDARAHVVAIWRHVLLRIDAYSPESHFLDTAAAILRLLTRAPSAAFRQAHEGAASRCGSRAVVVGFGRCKACCGRTKSAREGRATVRCPRHLAVKLDDEFLHATVSSLSKRLARGGRRHDGARCPPGRCIS